MADRDAGSTCTELNRRAVTAQEEARRAIAEASTLRRAVEAQSECSRRRSSLPRSGGSRLPGGAGPATTPPPSPPRPLPGGLEARLKSLRMPAGWEAEVRALVADAVHESPSRAADDPVRAVSLDASPDAARGFVAPAEGAPPPVPVVLASEFDYEAYDPGWPRATGDGIEARVRRCEDALRQVELSQDPEVEAPDRRDGAARTSGWWLLDVLGLASCGAPSCGVDREARLCGGTPCDAPGASTPADAPADAPAARKARDAAWDKILRPDR